MRLSPCRRPEHAAWTEPTLVRPGSPYAPSHLMAISTPAAYKVASEMLGEEVRPSPSTSAVPGEWTPGRSGASLTARPASALTSSRLTRSFTPERPASALASGRLTRSSSQPASLLVGPGLPVSADKLAAMQVANEELRARNHALLERTIKQEEELWRIKSASRSFHPSEHVATYPRRSESAHEAVEAILAATEPESLAKRGEATMGSLWQFLDLAANNCVRARADMRRAQAESLIQLEKGFNPAVRDCH